MRRHHVTILRVGLWLKNEGGTLPVSVQTDYPWLYSVHIESYILSLSTVVIWPPLAYHTLFYFISAFVRKYKGAHSLHRILVHILSHLASHRRLSRSLLSASPSYLRKWMSNEFCRINKITNSALSRKQVDLPLFFASSMRLSAAEVHCAHT